MCHLDSENCIREALTSPRKILFFKLNVVLLWSILYCMDLLESIIKFKLNIQKCVVVV